MTQYTQGLIHAENLIQGGGINAAVACWMIYLQEDKNHLGEKLHHSWIVGFQHALEHYRMLEGKGYLLSV